MQLSLFKICGWRIEYVDHRVEECEKKKLERRTMTQDLWDKGIRKKRKAKTNRGTGGRGGGEREGELDEGVCKVWVGRA